MMVVSIMIMAVAKFTGVLMCKILCPVCGKGFMKRRKDSKLCSIACSQKRLKRLKAARKRAVIWICDAPDCKKEYNRKRSDMRYCCKNCAIRTRARQRRLLETHS